MHQILVLNLEARRKDCEQMFAHHVIAIALIVSSYITNYHRIGNAILCLMDPSDILLSVSGRILTTIRLWPAISRPFLSALSGGKMLAIYWPSKRFVTLTLPFSS
ncbi:LAG1-domain-containing protein [Tilletiaria anomala UBC 951]|uniref:LAG1-domain-containing protein n=1 Tax=Tilletiaria anomala (strain ATCC 24038 / CBS 436.72 / UBC 951) TaxID=1037660 RepID=A0A066VMC7_TILAU|nr:LAG1-domain-containing protein [Tilletiaria anomala UBC 951]KDN42872.1 LAG1-domain-containing protein [Tilletiaria anomala UBC 951]